MSSTARMSSQRYIPHYSAIRRETQRKAPVQRRQTMILRREPFSQPGVDYRARKSALTRQDSRRDAAEVTANGRARRRADTPSIRCPTAGTG